MSSTRGRPRGGEAVSDPSHAPTIAKSTKNIRKSSTQALPEDVPKENIEINQNKKEGDSKLTLTSPASLPVFQLQHPDIAVSTTHASSSSSAQPVLQSKLSAESLTQHNILINKKESDKNKSKKENVPKVVELAYKINCVSDVSAVSCTFEVDIKIFLFWTDEKLIGRKKESFVDYETEKDLFEPNIIVTNEHQLTVVEKDCNTKINDSETGGVKRTQHFKGTVFLGSMELKMFPFDCQNLQICFKPYRLKRDECILRPKEDESAVDRHIMHEWAVLGDCVKVFFTDPSTSSTRKSYSTLFITVLARRKYNWHVTNVFIPTAAFLFISWLTFFYGANARSERNDISIATLLASISNKFVIGDHIPKVDYRTLLDTYLDFCFYLQLVTMFATVLVHWVRSSEVITNAPVIAERLNWCIFATELIVAYIFHEWMYFKVCNNELDIEHWVHRSKVMELEEPGLTNPMLSITPRPHTAGNQSPRPVVTPRANLRGQQYSSAAPLDSPGSSHESYELDREMIQLARRKQRSTLVRFLQSLALEPDRHNLDDGSLMKSIFASEHFIHFGAVQISKKVLTDIKLGLESTLVSAQMKTQHQEEVVQTFILARARAYFSRIVQERKEGRIGACHDLLLSTGVSTPRTTAAAAEEKETTIQNYAAVLVQTLFRRRRAVRRRQMIIEKRRRKAAITIQRWLRKLKKKWTKKGKGRKGKASKR